MIIYYYKKCNRSQTFISNNNNETETIYLFFLLLCKNIFATRFLILCNNRSDVAQKLFTIQDVKKKIRGIFMESFVSYEIMFRKIQLSVSKCK